MKNLQKFKKDFKRDLLIKVVVGLRHNKIKKEEASALARRVLEIFREEQAKKVFERINKLTETYPEILDIFIKRGFEFDEKEKEEKMSEIVVYLKTKSQKKGGVN